MSHISRMCSRMSSGRPLSGRGIVISGLALGRWRARRPFACAARIGAARFSTSRTLVEILVELGPVAGADPPAQAGGLVAHAVEDALVALAAAVVEQAVEGQRRIDLHRHRRGRALPGDVRAVGHREVRLVVAGDRLLAAQDHARLDGLLAQVPGELLVDADAPLELGPLLKRGPREDVAGLARVDADARGVLVEQAVDDVDLGLRAAPAAPGTGPAPSTSPAPLAHQFVGLTPQPMNSAANRFGQGAGTSPAIAAAPQTGTDSSQGRAIVTPTPRRNVRRDAWLPAGSVVCLLGSAHRLHFSAVSPSTRLFRNCGLVTMRLDQAAEAVAVGRQPRAHALRWSRRPRGSGCVPGRRPAACGTGCRRIRRRRRSSR